MTASKDVVAQRVEMRIFPIVVGSAKVQTADESSWNPTTSVCEPAPVSPEMSTGILPSVSLVMSLEPMYERFPEYEAVAPASRFSPSGAHADGS